jgi:hypothetical protein
MWAGRSGRWKAPHPIRCLYEACDVESVLAVLVGVVHQLVHADDIVLRHHPPVIGSTAYGYRMRKPSHAAENLC